MQNFWEVLSTHLRTIVALDLTQDQSTQGAIFPIHLKLPH